MPAAARTYRRYHDKHQALREAVMSKQDIRAYNAEVAKHNGAVARMGHNGPPSPIETALECADDLAAFVDANPVYDPERGDEWKRHLDRAKATLKTLEDARTKLVKPLNDQVKAINAEHKAASEKLDKVAGLIERAIKDHLRREEERRRAEAAEAARIAAEAARAALEAERKAHEEAENAALGDLDAAPAAAAVDADQALRDAINAARIKQLAERDAENVRLSGGFGRAVSLRTVEVLRVVDLIPAVRAMADDEDLIAAVLTAARRFRTTWNELPPGIEAEKVRQ